MRIVIAGGGIAGWLTAMFAQRLSPQATIVVIESPRLNRLDIEEATTFGFRWALQTLGLSLHDLIASTSTTCKSGTLLRRFRRGRDYFVNFVHPPAMRASRHWTGSPDLLDYETLWFGAIGQGRDPNEAQFGSLSMRGLLPARIDDDGRIAWDAPVNYHISTEEAAAYLQRAGESRGISRIEGVISEVIRADDGGVSALALDDGRIESLDFVFDCTGLSRRVIREFPEAEWVSTSDLFPVDSSILIRASTPRDSIGAYTIMTAMRHGWMATMPVETKTGRWYNYASKYTDESAAVAEVESLLGAGVEVTGRLRYQSGYYRRPAVQNVIAIGLASMFFEPMAATTSRAIGAALLSLNASPSLLMSQSEVGRSLYNAGLSRTANVSISLIYSRYLAGGLGGDFWSSFSVDKAPTALRLWLRDARSGDLRKSVYDTGDWADVPTSTILSHLGASDAGCEAIRAFYRSHLSDQPVDTAIRSCKKTIEQLAQQYLTNEQLLAHLREAVAV